MPLDEMRLMLEQWGNITGEPRGVDYTEVLASWTPASKWVVPARWREVDFELVWGFSCQAIVLGCTDSFLFPAGKAVFRQTGGRNLQPPLSSAAQPPTAPLSAKISRGMRNPG